VTTWEGLLSSTINGFRPVAIDRCAGKAASQMWNELRLVADVGAWRSASALSGQLLELVLKQALLERGAARRIGHDPLAKVIDVARTMGLFTPATQAMTVANSIYVAKELRNIASHGSPWQSDTTAQRATYSVIFLICFAGYLFPRMNSAEELLSEPASRPDLLEESHAEAIEAGDHLDVQDFAARVRVSSPRGLVKWWHASDPEARRKIASAVQANFASVIENVGYGRVRSLWDLSRCLQDAGLSNHARCCGILLPHDASALRFFSQRSPGRFSKYVYECMRAEPRLFDASFNKGGLGIVKQTAARWLLDPQVSFANVCNLLASCPGSAIKTFLHDNNAPIINRVKTGQPADTLAILRVIRLSRSCDPKIESNILAELAAAADRCPMSDLGPVPLRLHQLRLLDEPVADGVVNVLIRRATADPDLFTASRILWDLWAFSVNHHETALRASIDRASEIGHGDSAWAQLLMHSVSVAEGRKHPAASLEIEFSSLRLNWPEGESDRFQQLRVGVVLVSYGVNLPSTLVAKLRHLAQTTHLTQENNQRSPKTIAFLRLCKAAWT
jgi:hypothetical protein